MGRESFEHEVVVKVVGPAEMGGAAGAGPEGPADVAGAAGVGPAVALVETARAAGAQQDGSTETGAGQDGEGEAGDGHAEGEAGEGLDGEGGASVEHEEGGACEAGVPEPVDEASVVEFVLMQNYQPVWGRWAIKMLKPVLEALDPSELVPADVDVEGVVTFVASIGWRDAVLERRMRFYRRGGERTNGHVPVDWLRRLVWVAWHAWQSQRRAELEASDSTISLSDFRRAVGTLHRMIAVLERGYEGRDDEVALVVGRLDQRTSNLGVVAENLLTLAELYGRDDVRAVIGHHKRFFLADADEAVRLAGLLSAARGVRKEGKVRRKAERTRRAVTLLVKAYEEHARRGRSIFAGREDVAATYPTLDTAARSPRRERPAGEPSGGEAPGGDEPAGGGGESGG
ncbi:MAG TPA: hypothetical protein VFS43_26500 [Polyangiaceae bacterium]|nr:hypothetical protein [Polyangiaceae bacterium]